MKRVLTILLLLTLSLSFGYAQPVKAGVVASSKFIGGGDQASITKFTVRYNAADATVLTSKTGLTGPFNTGSRPLAFATMGLFNPGVGTMLTTGKLFSTSNTSLHIFTREAYATAAAAALGTEPAYDSTITGANSHGSTFDPILKVFYCAGGNTTFKVVNLAGATLETVTVPAVTQFSMLYFDWTSGVLYTTESAANGHVQGVKKIAGTWTLVYDSNFLSNDGVSVDHLRDKIGVHHQIRTVLQDSLGLNIIMCPQPTDQMGGNQEGLWIDPVDASFWSSFPLLQYQAVPNGNVLCHYDPLKTYLKDLNFPSMYPWSDFKLNGNSVSGRWHEEILTGNNFSYSPVIDFGANTDQQTEANWRLRQNLTAEAATVEWRGSNTASTLSPLAPVDYHTLQLYDPNGANDGWGDTVPEDDWGVDVPNLRYVQFRIKPVAPTPPVEEWTPYDLGDSLLYWVSADVTPNGETDEYVGLRVDYANSNGVPLAKNIADPGRTNNFEQTGAVSTRPLLTSGMLDINLSGGNRFVNGQSGAISFTEALGACEITIIGRKAVNTSRAVYFALVQTSTNNNQLVLEHIASSGSPANSLSLRYVDDSGNAHQYGFVDATGTNFKMISWVIGDDVENKLYINKVLQTLTIHAGSNTGQGFNDIPNSNGVYIGRRQATTANQGDTDILDIWITPPLNAGQQRKFYDYGVAKGKL